MESSQHNLPPNPRESTNCLSKIFLCWTYPIFKKGYEKILQIEDVYQSLKSDKSELLGDRLEV